MDYSCGTGIFCERLLKSTIDCPRILMMDSSPKYLKLSYDKFGGNYKFFFRLMRYLKEKGRLQTIDESMGGVYKELLDGIICTNAIHLYPTISDTMKSWSDILVKGGKLLINSGNILNPLMDGESKLIDQTVEEISKISFDIVKSDPKYSKYLDLIDDFITDCGTEYFRNETFSGSDIDDYDLTLNYSCEVELENATIDINDYFCSNFSFEYDRFIQWINDFRNTEETMKLSNLMSRELFELITEIIDTSVRNIDTSISFSQVDDFECEMDSYKKIEVTDVTIDSDEFRRTFKNDFDYNTSDIEDIIKNYHNFKSEEVSEDNSDDDSEE